MNAFSMFYSDLMDTSASHPALMLQDEQQMGAYLPTLNNDLFQKKVKANMMVIISGVNSPQGNKRYDKKNNSCA